MQMAIDWERVQELFAAVSELSPAERTAYLAGAGAGAGELAEVEKLLASHDGAGDFLKAPLLHHKTEVLPAGFEMPVYGAVGKMIGPYKLERVIGEGGMGAVYLATRDDAEYRRKVAVKLIRHHGDRETLLRFRNERQILAGLEHPNIARMYEGGTDDGGPYLVMEYVEGLRIDTYCRKSGLDVDARLRLFQQVCAAVSYAHRNLLVHRDLKPANILVTADGVPKLLDFGIAKSLEGADPGTTQEGQRPMTPAYASPEQVRGAAITTASDVYSLGVVLYELLTGASPYRLEDSSDLTLRVAIRDQAPIRPSTAARAARTQLRGDLDTIVLKTLTKEPESRYGSVRELSEDIGRFLDHLPVLARRPSLPYRWRKFVRRHRLAVAAGVVAAAVVVFFVAALARQTRIATRQSERAMEQSQIAGAERDHAERALGAMVEAFKASDPEQARGRELTAREILDRGADKVRLSLAGDPESLATLLAAMGEVYVSLGLFGEAETLHREALGLRRGGEAEGLSLYQLGELELWRREYRAAVPFYRQAVNRLAGQARARSLRGLGLALVQLQESEGEALLSEALEILSAHFERTDPEVLRCLDGLGLAAVNRGDYDAAEMAYREIVEAGRAQGAGPSLGRRLADLGEVRRRQGAASEADALHAEALPLLREALGGTENPYVADALGRLTAVQLERGDIAGAELALREILAMRGSAARLTVAEALHNLAPILAWRGELGEAAAVANEALELQRELLGETHEEVAASLCTLGRIAQMAEDFPTARAHLEACAAVLERLHPEGHPQMAFAWDALGLIARAEGGCEAAEPWFRRALDIRVEHLGAEHVLTQRTAAMLEACSR